jgi:rod shape-determining protein MreD
MIQLIIRHALRFVLLTGLQVFLLNNVQLNTFINPFLYVLFLLWLPVHLPRLLLLPLALICGLTIDMFQNTPGMHAAACLLLVYIRPGWLKIIAPREGYEADAEPSVGRFSIAWYLTYAAPLVFVHHLLLFCIEVFRFSEFPETLGRILSSTVVTLALILIVQYLTVRPKRGV